MSGSELAFVDRSNPILKVRSDLLAEIKKSQQSAFAGTFEDAESLIGFVCDQLKLKIKDFSVEKGQPAESIADLPHAKLTAFYRDVLNRNDVPEQAIRLHAENLASRTHLLRAFAEPDSVIALIKNKVLQVINTFPRTGADIECGRNKGDVLDPFILTATQYLLHEGNFEAAITSTVAHKALMIIEGLLGHLHEDVIGMMRGNIRVPEPRGEDQERFDYSTNPFPGADIMQPPCRSGDKIKFHQVKSKTGSAKGGDGKRLGEQLRFLQEHYDAEIYYHALVGNTLVGHRSKAGVEKAAPSVVVLVGAASFRVLTGSTIGPQLLLRLYQEVFLAAAEESKYSIEEVTRLIVTHFTKEAETYGEGYLETILAKVTEGAAVEQDNRLFNKRKAEKLPGL